MLRKRGIVVKEGRVEGNVVIGERVVTGDVKILS